MVRNMRLPAIVALLLPIVVLTACSASTPGDADQAPPPAIEADAAASQAEPTIGPEPWVGPSDGSWDYGDVGYGNTWEGRLSDYRVTTVGLPEFGPLIDAKVEATGTFHVERHQDRGYYDSILDDLRFGVTPGNVHGEKHDESYGLKTRTTCAQPRIAVGDTTECRVTFAAPTEEMQDFRWWLNGSSIAAWPGQTTD